MSRVGSRSHASSRGNKLGYYRASQACDFCRKRKSRCLAAVDQNETRCATCTRLGRKCIVVTVDKMPQVHSPSQLSTRPVSTIYESKGGLQPHQLGDDPSLDTAESLSPYKVSTTTSNNSLVIPREITDNSSLGDDSFGQLTRNSTFHLTETMPDGVFNDPYLAWPPNLLNSTFSDDLIPVQWSQPVLLDDSNMVETSSSRNSGQKLSQIINADQMELFPGSWMPSLEIPQPYETK